MTIASSASEESTETAKDWVGAPRTVFFCAKHAKAFLLLLFAVAGVLNGIIPVVVVVVVVLPVLEGAKAVVDVARRLVTATTSTSLVQKRYMMIVCSPQKPPREPCQI